MENKSSLPSPIQSHQHPIGSHEPTQNNAVETLFNDSSAPPLDRPKQEEGREQEGSEEEEEDGVNSGPECQEQDFPTAEDLKDLDDTESVNSSATMRTYRQNNPPSTDTQNVKSKSERIGSLQNIFTDSQKIAYVGLCYLIMHKYKQALGKNKKAVKSYTAWSDMLMLKMYTYINIVEEEQRMITQLSEHGLLPSDLSKSLIEDAQNSAKKLEEYQLKQQAAEQDALEQGLPLPAPDFCDEEDVFNGESATTADPDAPADIRYTILSHLFILCIGDGVYDARERALLRNIADHLKVPWTDVIQLENTIAEQLRVHENSGNLRRDEHLIGKRNVIESKGRWIFLGLAGLAGGAVIGLTAGLAAPLIGGGIGIALTGMGVTGVTTAGVTSFMATAGTALITSGGVLAGGGVSAKGMAKRTRGINEFEFLSIDDALVLIEENKIKRATERRRKWRREYREAKAKKAEEKLALEKEEREREERLGRKKSTEGGEDWEIQSTEMSVVSEVPSTAISETTVEQSTIEGYRKLPKEQTSRQTNVLITIAGWLTYGSDDYSLPFSTLTPGVYGDQYALIWESNELQQLGSTLKLLATEIGSFIFQQGICAAILPTLMAGLTGPLWAIKLTYLMDNPWGIGLSKAKKAGRLLADTLINQVQDNRPVTLIGYSLGARVIYFCLLEMASRDAYGIIEDVYLFGCPVMADHKEWTSIMSVVSGQLVNGYLSKDWVLGVLYRASSASWKTVAGLGPIENVAGLKNVQLDGVIDGHLEYRLGMPKILQAVGFNVTKDYFDDEDEVEQKEKAEMEEYRLQHEIEKARQKEEKIRAKKEEYERRKLEKEQARKSGKVTSWFSRSSDNLQDGKLDPFWTPKELPSTMPVLDPLWTPKELSSTMPVLVIDSVEDEETDSPFGQTKKIPLVGRSSTPDFSLYNPDDSPISSKPLSIASTPDVYSDFGSFTPKELPSTMPKLIIDINVLDQKLKDLGMDVELAKFSEGEQKSEVINASGAGFLADNASDPDDVEVFFDNTEPEEDEGTTSANALNQTRASITNPIDFMNDTTKISRLFPSINSPNTVDGPILPIEHMFYANDDDDEASDDEDTPTGERSFDDIIKSSTSSPFPPELENPWGS